MFTGPYTLDKCLATCDLKNKWYQCNTTWWTARNLLRDKNFVRGNASLDAIEKCIADHPGNIDVNKCYDECRFPCSKQTYKVRIEYAPNSPGVNGTAIYFSMDRKETLISEAAKTDLLTVLSSFGGTLGLLAGVSVLSLLELLIWVVLFVAELVTSRCLHRK